LTPRRNQKIQMNKMRASSLPIPIEKLRRAEFRHHGGSESFALAIRLGITIGLSLFMAALVSTFAQADGPLSKVNHVIIVMQENHSFDNYFGALPYSLGSPYHAASGAKCASTDHLCLAGLSCIRHADGTYSCTNSNLEANGSTVNAFHDSNYCVAPDLDHSWPSSHLEGNLPNPNNMLKSSPNNGFVIVNDKTEQIDTVESATEDDTMGFYNETDLPFYYSLAQTFAIDDQYFCDVVGPTIPNRFYLMAATSFGHHQRVVPSGPQPYLQTHYRHDFRPTRQGWSVVGRLLLGRSSRRRFPEPLTAAFPTRDTEFLRRRSGGQAAGSRVRRSDAGRWHRHYARDRRASAA
jgi:phospholipase C